MTPEETKRWLPRPTGIIRDYIDRCGGHDTSIELAILEDITHRGLIQFIVDGDRFSNWHSPSGKVYKQFFSEVQADVPFARYSPIGDSECFVFSSNMRFLVHRVAHLAALLMVTDDDTAVQDVKKLIALITARNYGLGEGREFAGAYELIKLPWEDDRFCYKFDQDSGSEYSFLCNILIYFILEHERQHALQGHGYLCGVGGDHMYLGDAESQLGSREYMRAANWLFEFSADWHAVINILSRLGERSLPMLTPASLYGKNSERMQAAFLLGAGLLMHLLYFDLLTRRSLNTESFLSIKELSTGALDIRIFEKRLVEAVRAELDVLSLTHPHAHIRMVNILLAIAASGAPKFLGKGFSYDITDLPLLCLSKLAVIDKGMDKRIYIDRNYASEFPRLCEEREMAIEGLRTSLGIKYEREAREAAYRPPRASVRQGG